MKQSHVVPATIAVITMVTASFYVIGLSIGFGVVSAVTGFCLSVSFVAYRAFCATMDTMRLEEEQCE